MNYWDLSPDNIFVAAHRGWSAAYPENTMAAFEAALELGVDQIETDIRVTKDGHLVLIHDERLERTTNGQGLVRETTLEELRKLDAGNGEKIPTLVEFMERMQQDEKITIDFELKEYPTPGYEETAYEVCDRVLKMIDDYGFTDRCVVNTFHAKLHEYIREKYGNKYRQHVYFPVSHMGEYTVDPYSYGYCCCMFGPEWGSASKEEFDKMAARGVQPWAGASVKDEATVDGAIAKGAYLITCNNPDEILRLLRLKGKHR